nr:hypothetical protein [Tanacetum cinerariifolium]
MAMSFVGVGDTIASCSGWARHVQLQSFDVSSGGIAHILSLLFHRLFVSDGYISVEKVVSGFYDPGPTLRSRSCKDENDPGAQGVITIRLNGVVEKLTGLGASGVLPCGCLGLSLVDSLVPMMAYETKHRVFLRVSLLTFFNIPTVHSMMEAVVMENVVLIDVGEVDARLLRLKGHDAEIVATAKPRKADRVLRNPCMDETNTTYYAGGVNGNRRPVRLMDRIEAGGFDNEIFRLTHVKREASHTLIADLARGFDYMNSDSDDSASSLGDIRGKYEAWSKLTSEKHKEVMDTIYAMWDALMTKNPNVMSESPIVQSVSIQDKPSSYIATAGGSLPKPSAAASKLDPSKSRANFRSLFSESLYEGAKFSIPRKVVETVSTPFANTLYGYFIGKRIEFPVMEYYVSIPSTVVTSNVATPTVKKTNDGFQTVGKKKKKGKSKSTNRGQDNVRSKSSPIRYERADFNSSQRDKSISFDFLNYYEDAFIDKYYVLPPLLPCFQPSQPPNEHGYESLNMNNKVDIDSMTLADYNLYIARQMKNLLNDHSFSFTPQFFTQAPNTPNIPVDKKDSDFDEILDDLFSIRAENLRMRQKKIQHGCNVERYKDTNHKSGNLLNFPIFPATNEFSSNCEQDVDLEKEEAEPVHTTSPNDDYVAPKTIPILDELLEDKILNVVMVDEEVDSTRDLEELERLLVEDPHFTELQAHLFITKPKPFIHTQPMSPLYEIFESYKSSTKPCKVDREMKSPSRYGLKSSFPYPVANEHQNDVYCYFHPHLILSEGMNTLLPSKYG